MKRLVAKGARLKAYDPAVSSVDLDGVEVVADAYAACEGAAAIVVATEWDEFKWLDLDKVADLVAERHIIDARNLLDRGALRRRGFTYQGVGRS
jgi:UDPglucose 6-dehydrogenase